MLKAVLDGSVRQLRRRRGVSVVSQHRSEALEYNPGLDCRDSFMSALHYSLAGHGSGERGILPQKL